MRFGRVVFFRRKIRGDLERQNSAIVIMPQDCFIGHADLTADQLGRGRDLAMRELKRLGIVKFQRGRKIDGEVIAQLVLRERRAITIGDLAAWSGNVENVSARQFLCLECGNNLFIKSRRRNFSSGQRFCAWSRMTSPSVFAKIGVRPPLILPQFRPSPQFLRHWRAAIVLPTRTFAATGFCDAD